MTACTLPGWGAGADASGAEAGAEVSAPDAVPASSSAANPDHSHPCRTLFTLSMGFKPHPIGDRLASFQPSVDGHQHEEGEVAPGAQAPECDVNARRFLQSKIHEPQE